jgi:hypothetical protein
VKNATVIVLLAVLAGCSAKHETTHPESHRQTADAHPGHDMTKMGAMAGTLVVKTEPAEVKAGQRTKLSLMIHDADGVMVKDFDVVHEKKVHLIVVSDGLSQFDHIHPDLDSVGNLTVTYAFPTGGKYHLYADYKPAGKDQAVATADIQVVGDAPPAPELIPNTPGKATGNGLNANVAFPKAKAGEVTKITFGVLDSMDKPVTDLQPYLGAMGHLVVISADGKLYVHAHPVEGKSGHGVVEFAAHFTRPGIYKGWGQFQRAGQVYTVSFVLKVD